MAREKALVTPSVLRWAREAHGLDVVVAANKLKRDPAELKAWESGEDAPTLAQARALALLYRRPLAVFFLPEPPQERQAPPLPDFRRLPADIPADFTPELRLLIRLSSYRQDWVREELRMEGARPLGWVGAAKGERSFIDLAARIRKWLGVPSGDLQTFDTFADALRFWTDRVEERGAFVFQSGGPTSTRIDPIIARGFALVDRYAPFIMLNGADSESGRIFTLIHEVVHVWIGEGGVSNLEQIDNPKTPEHRIEQFCNKVAAEMLVPLSMFQRLWQSAQRGDLRETVSDLSRRFRVSREVIARRAADAQFIEWGAYLKLRSEFVAEWKSRSRASEGGPDWYLMVPKRAGYSLTRRAISAFAEGRLTGSDLAELLNSKINRLADIAKNAGAPRPEWGPAA